MFNFYPDHNNSSAEALMQLIKFTIMDTSCILRLMVQMNVLPLALQITKIAGNLMSRTLIGGRAERNEFLLLHAFNEKDFILPDKQYKKKTLSKVLTILLWGIHLLFLNFWILLG